MVASFLTYRIASPDVRPCLFSTWTPDLIGYPAVYDDLVWLPQRNRVGVFNVSGQLLFKYVKGEQSEAIAFDNERRVFITHAASHSVSAHRLDGTRLMTFGKSRLQAPAGIAAHQNLVFVVDRNCHCICVFDNVGAFVRRWGRYGQDVGRFDRPFGIAIHSPTLEVFVSDSNNHRIQVRPVSFPEQKR